MQTSNKQFREKYTNFPITLILKLSRFFLNVLCFMILKTNLSKLSFDKIDGKYIFILMGNFIYEER